ncbi:protein of unknown function [Pseudomonas sp. JV551A1]|uniref:Uncharacterized protein n=1 Tax=Pseudomonas inefficax TaxID=2078786 RepID=A0AAQ1STU9_9PSED|nr:protein of unknown function [Pseudomonas sp. JV551A1]SPO61043.1 protein of unknown function [Pseudomonas inefficax]
MEAVTAGDVVAVHPVHLAVFFIGQVGPFALEFVRLYIACRIDDRRAAGFTCLHQVTGHFGLAVYHHRLATGQGLEVQALAAPADQQLDTLVYQALTVHALSHPGFTQQVDRALFQYPGTDAAEHVFGGLAFDDDRIDTGLVQQLAEQQARRTCTNNCDLSFHCCCLCADDAGPGLAVGRHLLLGFALAFLLAKTAIEVCYSMHNLHFYKKRSINGQVRTHEIHPPRRPPVQALWRKPSLARHRPAALRVDPGA